MAVNRRVLVLLILLALTLGFGVWQWFRPYEWKPDSAAGAEIRFSQVKRDQGFAWLDVHLKLTDPGRHDLQKPVRLVLADGTEVAPADTTLEGTAERPLDAISFRFWLELEKLAGPLRLRINDGVLVVRQSGPLPRLEPREIRYHQTNRW